MKSDSREHLLSTYGPLISLEKLAQIFDRSPQGLRVSLCSKSSFSSAINAAKIKYGRRIYFKSELIATVIDDETWKTDEH